MLDNNIISGSTVGVYVKTGAIINDMVSDTENIEEVTTEITNTTNFSGCGTNIQIQ